MSTYYQTSLQKLDAFMRFMAPVAVNNPLQPFNDPPLISDSPNIVWRMLVFLALCLAILGTAAWFTNAYTNYWWMRVEEDGYMGSPYTLRHDCRISLLDHLYEYNPRWLLVIPAVLAEFCDVSMFLFTLIATYVALLATQSFPVAYAAICRHLVHFGLSGTTYTSFTASLVHPQWPWVLVQGLIALGNYGAYRWIGEYPEEWRDPAPTALRSWEFGFFKLWAFHLLASGFSVFVANIVALLSHWHLVAGAPARLSVMAMNHLFCDLPVGLGISVGSEGALTAARTISYLVLREDSPFFTWMLALESAANLYNVARDPQMPASRALAGQLFGLLYYWKGDFVWECARSLVGNRRTVYDREPALRRDRTYLYPRLRDLRTIRLQEKSTSSS